jgi:hypothetical protein
VVLRLDSEATAAAAGRHERAAESQGSTRARCARRTIYRKSTSACVARRVLATLQFSLGFLFSTVLHCKDKLNLGDWVGAVQSCFSQYPQTVHWFLRETLLKKECSWLEDYLYLCPDGRAGNTFVSILISAVRCMVCLKETKG